MAKIGNWDLLLCTPEYSPRLWCRSYKYHLMFQALPTKSIPKSIAHLSPPPHSPAAAAAATTEKMAGTVIIFDFDMTIIDCDSDNLVVDELGATDLFRTLLPIMPWNPLMNRMMAELHAQGKTIKDIAEVLRRAPLDPHVVSAIKSAYALGCDLRVVSDANMFFIEVILQHHGLIGCFTEINTNPCNVDDEGRLQIFPFHDSALPSHGCHFCPPNMCKGKILEQIRAATEAQGSTRVIYLGDGKGDYCPSLRLREGDFVMPRTNYTLWNLIQRDPNLVKAEVHEWSDGEEVERVLLQLIGRLGFVNNGAAAVQFSSVDCKTETMPPLLPKAVPVPM